MPTDKFAVRLVIATFAIIALFSLAAMTVLAFRHQTIPRALDGAFTFTTGALVGVIAKTTTTEPFGPESQVVEAPAVVVPPAD